MMTLEPGYLPHAQYAAIETASIKASDPAYRARVEDAAVKFEGLFIAQMLSEMKKATDQLKGDDGFADRSSEAMLDYANRAVADAIAKQRGFGIADTLVAQMLPPDATPSKD
ncbi:MULTISPECIES: flagellar biosynthesis protein FlgJ [Burkholderia]|uniref:flagellar biosynthesis protein FlgJ n=1 Tax=Burkholderia TaxID=32008 RepID=UPI00192A0A25|nr:flagellar biosynthesis protein FlgJ [Burkholderia sp. KCJ3K979]MBL3962181.1 flagellar biosynthesis protein FlgJ [Burkholderia sp. KCJ3K979]